ncbi:acetyl-CoA synthetase-like protein [Roridomyces roridus]|uniref:Acetyl-CoA synthetase-like protein n=1 Tax=Roridomyces roridus TaxID=1738132 RepID=A0AAD7BZG4_9AGAR|nr:acetyl-CoA synthetase-like protein [Roridomyces roridus]
MSVQGVLNSTTFHPPPFDSTLSIPELYEYHARNSSDHAVFVYSDTDEGTTHWITYLEAWERIRQAAGFVQRHLTSQKDGVVAVMTFSDTLSYIYLVLGIMSLGLTPFPMSPRITPEATVHLLSQTGARAIFTNTEGAIRDLVDEVAGLLQHEGMGLRVLPMLNYEQLVKMEVIAALEIPKKMGEADVVLIHHSSGTTAFPKPIRMTNKGLINLTKVPRYGEMDLTNKRIAGHTNSLFHVMGLATYIWPLWSGAIFAIYKPKPIIPTPANFLDSWTADKCDIVYCVPAFVEAWAQDTDNVPKLAALDSIVFAGASLNKNIGDMLEEAGAVLHPFWGSTEIGGGTMFIARPPPKGQWEYFKFSNHATFAMKPHPHLENVFEAIMIPTEIYFPHVFNTTHEGKPAYNLGDLLERHLTDPTRWKVYGRTDDQIMLSTAENVNPLPLEAVISQNKNITAAIVFGIHRLHPGLLVQPAIDVESLEEFKDLIMPTVEKANSVAPAYSRITRNMIITTSPSKPLEFTPKGTPRRQVAIRLYAAEIDALYEGEEMDREFPDRA